MTMSKINETCCNGKQICKSMPVIQKMSGRKNGRFCISYMSESALYFNDLTFSNLGSFE